MRSQCQSGKFQEALACFQAAGALEAKDATFAIAAGTLSRFAERECTPRVSCVRVCCLVFVCVSLSLCFVVVCVPRGFACMYRYACVYACVCRTLLVSASFAECIC